MPDRRSPLAASSWSRPPRPVVAAALSLALAACAAAPQLAAQQPPGAADRPPQVIVAGGNGEARVTPDRAAISFTIETRSATAAAAGRDNARTAKAVLDTLRALGIPASDLGTSGYTVYPEQRHDPGTRRPSVSGYVARNGVRVQLTKTELVGSTIDAALAKGANVVAGLEFLSSNTARARREAIAAAVEEARGDAEAAARAAGGSLGALVELNVAPEFERPVYAAAMMGRAAGEAVPTPVEPGEQRVRAVVQGRWTFVAGVR